jgi:hypothetical protein
MEVGPDASPDEIATLACRTMLVGDGASDEQLVRGFTESLGFVYVPRQIAAAPKDAFCRRALTACGSLLQED